MERVSVEDIVSGKIPTIKQEELREYFLDRVSLDMIENYFETLACSGFASEFYDGAFYISQQVYGNAIVVGILEEDGLLSIIGDSSASGSLKKDLERELGKDLTEQRHVKGQVGVYNMGFVVPPIDQDCEEPDDSDNPTDL